MVKPEFFESETLARCPFGARLAFIGMWVFADDKGHLRFSVRRLRALIFPMDDMADATFAGYLRTLERVGCIRGYEADGMRYVEVRNFQTYQKINHPSPTTIPDPKGSLSGKTISQWLDRGGFALPTMVGNTVDNSVENHHYGSTTGVLTEDSP